MRLAAGCHNLQIKYLVLLKYLGLKIAQYFINFIMAQKNLFV